MTPTEFLAARLKGSTDILKMTLADFTDADMLVRPVPSANHTTWQIGHLAASEARMVAESSGGSPTTLPLGFSEKFGKGTSRTDDSAAFPNKAELLDVLGKVRQRSIEWVGSLKPEQLGDPSPERLRGFAPTLGDLASMLSEHVYMHIGQFQVIRRKLGKPILF